MFGKGNGWGTVRGKVHGDVDWALIVLCTLCVIDGPQAPGRDHNPANVEPTDPNTQDMISYLHLEQVHPATCGWRGVSVEHAWNGRAVSGSFILRTNCSTQPNRELGRAFSPANGG